MLFEGDAALKKIDVLSGGEKSRVMLGKLLTEPVNLLILDEPTNHLDMESCDAMLAALDNFTGAVIMVTHNEMFLHALAQRLVVFQKDGPFVFEGAYGEFLEKIGWEDEDISPARKGNNNGGVCEKYTKKELKRKRSEIISARAKQVKPLEERITEIENEIEGYEGKLTILTAEMQNASQAGNGKKIGELGQTIHECQSAIDRLFEELETVSDKFTEKKSLFDKELEELESRFESAAS
jgi:ATP-binding cassette subfamily F protein 3